MSIQKCIYKMQDICWKHTIYKKIGIYGMIVLNT